MDYKEQYEPLTQKLKGVLPLSAYPERGLVQVFNEKGKSMTLKTELFITDVFNSGDISGILCTVENANKEVLACALSHLRFPLGTPLYKEIIEYQKKREKRVLKLNMINSR